MIDRIVFYQSFCEKLKEGFVFTQIKKEKCRGLVRRRGFFAVYRLCERNYFLFDCSTRYRGLGFHFVDLYSLGLPAGGR